MSPEQIETIEDTVDTPDVVTETVAKVRRWSLDNKTAVIIGCSIIGVAFAIWAMLDYSKSKRAHEAAHAVAPAAANENASV